MRRSSKSFRLAFCLSLCLSSLQFSGCQADAPAGHVVIVTFDTTRADHIGAYGHSGVRTPTVDRLAAEGVLFEQAVAPAPITLPSHSSLMTGKMPFAHGVRDNGLFVLGEDQTTLAEVLSAADYQTAAAIASFPLTAQFGIDQGFESFDDRVGSRFEDLHGDRIFPKDRIFFDERQAARVNEAILPWLEEHHDEPFFLWVHYFDPHHPHEPPPPYDQLYAHDLYQGEISYSDESLGTLIGHLERLGVYDDTTIVMTSDHGEGNGEHDESTHSLLVYQTTLHVPLVIKPSAQLRSARSLTPGTRIGQRVSTVDVFPTLLEALGLPVPDGIQGQSLLPLMAGGPANRQREIYAETLSPRLSRNWGELRALFVDDLKYIHGPRPELFDLSTDPREIDDLVERQVDEAAGMKRRLETYLAENAVADVDSSIEVDDETLRRLQALGYLQTSGDRVGAIDERLRDDGEPPQDHAGTITIFSHVKNLLFRDRALDARDFIEALLRSDPENPHYLELLVSTDIRLGQTDEALATLEQLEALATGYPPPERLATMSGQIHLGNGNLEAAFDSFQRAESAYPTAIGQYRLAKLYSQRGQQDLEIGRLEQALEIDPQFSPARIDRAIHYALVQNVEAAEREFRTAIETDPYNSRALYNYGALLRESGRTERAIVAFERAVEIRPNYLQALYAVGETRWTLGDPSGARSALGRLVSLAPQSREAELARRFLEAVQ